MPFHLEDTPLTPYILTPVTNKYQKNPREMQDVLLVNNINFALVLNNQF